MCVGCSSDISIQLSELRIMEIVNLIYPLARSLHATGTYVSLSITSESHFSSLCSVFFLNSILYNLSTYSFVYSSDNNSIEITRIITIEAYTICALDIFSISKTQVLLDMKYGTHRSQYASIIKIRFNSSVANCNASLVITIQRRNTCY